MSAQEHSCLIVTDREQTAKTISMTLIKAGIKRFSAAYSQRELEAQMARELPHFVFFESDTSDASTMGMIKKIKSDPILAKALVLISRKPTKEEILEFVKLKVAGIFPKPLEPSVLIEKVLALVNSLKGRSPYGVFQFPFSAEAFLSFNAEVVGLADSFLAVQAPVDGAASARLAIRPKESSLTQVLVSLAGVVNSNDDSSRLNLFDTNRIVGKGKEWVSSLGKLTLGAQNKRKIVYQDANRERGQQVKELLSHEKIEVDWVDSVANLARTYFSAPEDYGCVFLIEPPTSGASIAWDKMIKEAPEGKRPLQVIATTASNPPQRNSVIWLQKPFGLDKFMETIEAAFVQTEKGSGSLAAAKIQCEYVVPSKLVGLDETGVLLQVPVSLLLNSLISFPLRGIKELGYPEQLKVISSSSIEGSADAWLVRLASSESAMNRFKNWKPFFEKLVEANQIIQTGKV